MDEKNIKGLIVQGNKTASNIITVQSINTIKSAIISGKAAYVKYTSTQDDVNPDRECYMLVLGISSRGLIGINDSGTIHFITNS